MGDYNTHCSVWVGQEYATLRFPSGSKRRDDFAQMCGTAIPEAQNVVLNSGVDKSLPLESFVSCISNVANPLMIIRARRRVYGHYVYLKCLHTFWSDLGDRSETNIVYECSVIFIFRRRSNQSCVEPPVPGRKIEDEGAPLDGDGGGDVDADGDPGGKDSLQVLERSHHQGD